MDVYLGWGMTSGVPSVREGQSGMYMEDEVRKGNWGCPMLKLWTLMSQGWEDGERS